MSRLAHWCLDRAARRWPAGIRAEMAQEWHAELIAIEAEPGGGRRGLAYALSLLTSPPLRDSSGAPRGWAETTGSPAAAGALILAGLLTLTVRQLADMVVELFRPGYDSTWLAASAGGLLTAVWCLPAGRWLGRRMPLEPGARFGPATSAAFAPLLMTPAVLLPAMTDRDMTYALALLIGLLVWIPGMALLGVAAVRGRRVLMLGTPLVAALAAAAATIPMIVTSREGLRAAAASLTVGDPPEEYSVIPEGALSSRTFYHFGPWAITLTVFAVLVLAYATAALRPLPAGPAPAADGPRTRPAPVIAAGAAVCALAVIAWAYTVAVLSPVLPDLGGEVYLWAAELRWTAILLAALALLVAVADRRRAVPAALVLAGGLIAGDAALVRLGAHGAGGLRLTLLVGGAAVALGWLAARGPLAVAGSGRVVRRRVAAAAVTAAVCVPPILSQGTPGVNHPGLPYGTVLTTTGLAVLGVLLAAVPAVTISRHRVPAWAAALIVVVPAAVTLAAGLAPVPTDSESTGNGFLGAFAGIPLAVTVVALLRRHRPRRRGRTAALWVLLALAGLPGTIVLWMAGAFPGHIVPDLLFAVEGLGYPADGISVVPGAALFTIPIAAIVATRLDGGLAADRRRPAPLPLTPVAPAG